VAVRVWMVGLAVERLTRKLAGPVSLIKGTLVATPLPVLLVVALAQQEPVERLRSVELELQVL
jgi:hypothetical protein